MNFNRRTWLQFPVVATIAFMLALLPLAAFAGEGESSESSDSGQITAGTADVSSSSEDQAAAKVANPQVKYRAYVGSKWSGWKKQGSAVGKANKKLQLISMKVDKDGLKGGIKYRVYSKGKGWLAWKSNGKAVGTKGWYVRGLQVKLTGALAKQFDVAYHVYLNGTGWQPWVVNGALAGSKGKLGQIERIQVKLVRKSSAQPLADGAYYVSLARNVNGMLQLPGSETSENVQMTKSSFSAKKTNVRFYVRNQSDGTVLLQSCASGLYLCERSGKVVQRAYADAAAYHWNVSEYRGGYVVANAGSGNKLAFSSGKAVAASKGSRWSFTITDAIADGTYTLSSQALDMMLAVKGKSAKNGAQLLVQEQQESNAEVFSFARVARNTYRIINVGSSKRIEVKGGSTAQNAVVRQNAPASGALQKWKLVLLADGSYRLVNKASKNSLTALGAGDDGSMARSSAYTGAATQKWSIAPQEAYRMGAEERAAKYAASQSSLTNYFIAVDLTNHWVCIFQGSKGSRKLIKSWQCSTGAPGSSTPTGEYTTGYKQYSFGSGYTVYYATAFIGYEYLFHSIKYNEGTFNVQDGRLGQSVSEGCIRLALSNAKWIYDNIPSGTKVKIYW